MIPFTKMHGLGNDFVVIDNRKNVLPVHPSPNTPGFGWRGIADRHTGIGCDQVVVLEKSEEADIFMRLYNADGSEAESCGNASRCVAWLVAHEKYTFPLPEGNAAEVTIETLAGILEAWVSHGFHVTVDMGEPGFEWQDIPLAEKSDTLHLNIGREMLQDAVAVSMGNPHMVFFVPDVNAVPLDRLGPELEKHPLFPARANVGVAQIGAKLKNGLDNIILRVFERGAGLTLACGTGACAALVAAHRRGLTGRKAAIKLPGGVMRIEWRETDNHVLMTGPVETVFKGEFDPAPWRIRGGAV